MANILICINNFGVGGAERLVVDDVNEMLARGYDVRLLTLKREPALSLARECRISKDRWQAIHFNGLFSISSWIAVWKYVRHTKPDVVFTHLWFTNTIMRVVCRCARVRNILSFEHNIYDTVKSGRMYMLDRFLQSWCRKIIAVSSAVKTSLISHGIDADRIEVVNNGIDISKYNVVDKNRNSGEKKQFMFVSVGRLIPQKGMDVLLEAFTRLPGDLIFQSILQIVGQGKEEGELKKYVEKKGISDRVQFLGIRNDIPALLASADAFVLSSRYEGLGIVVLEAMAAGLPIIITDFEAGKDMITHEANGLVVPREDPEALAKAMQKLMDDSTLRSNLAKAALERSRDFSIEEHVNKIMKI